MEMTIKKCLWELRTMRAGIKCGLQYAESDEDKEIDQEQIEASQMAIDTTSKYQKIAEIVKQGNANELGYEYIGEKITELLTL